MASEIEICDWDQIRLSYDLYLFIVFKKNIFLKYQNTLACMVLYHITQQIKLKLILKNSVKSFYR